MELVVGYDGWEIPDALWHEMEPLLLKAPSPKDHPLGCHRPRVDNRHAMNAILFKLRTGCQWAALKRVGSCSRSTAHRRLQEWAQAGVFEEFWRLGLLAYEELKGIDWKWLSMDGAITMARASPWLWQWMEPTATTSEWHERLPKGCLPSDLLGRARGSICVWIKVTITRNA